MLRVAPRTSPKGRRHTLEIVSGPAERGEVVCEDPGGPDYAASSYVRLTAVAFEDWSFRDWTVDDEEGVEENPVEVFMRSDRTVEAHFERAE